MYPDGCVNNFKIGVYMSIKQIKDELKKAYSDGNLHFRASSSVTPKDAYEIMKKCCPDGYNEFQAELLLLFPDDCMVTLAREYSVCIYVSPGSKRLPNRKSLNADEIDKIDGEVRIWWD